LKDKKKKKVAKKKGAKKTKNQKSTPKDLKRTLKGKI
jgi:hypothetical protein